MKGRILIIDDDLDFLRALSIRLRAEGLACEATQSRSDLFSRIQRDPPGAIILDLVMPEVDGYELCRCLKDDALVSKIPIVVLTAVPGHAITPGLRELGVARIIHKPFDSRELVSFLRGILSDVAAGGRTDV